MWGSPVSSKRPIYTVYVYRLAEDPEKNVIHTEVYPNGNKSRVQRVCGYFYSYETARRCILENWCDLFEHEYYNHAFIEEVHEGLYASGGCDIKEHFAAVYDSQGIIHVAALTEAPSPLFRNVVGWSMG